MDQHKQRSAVGALLGALARGSEVLEANVGDLARCARFLRGLAEFRVRPNDVFISSYPRSGTTWLQQVLSVLARGAEPDCEHISEVSPWFERRLALGACRAHDFERLRSPRIFKSHLPFRWLPRGARYVYALRDGRDVAVSYFHMYRSHLGFEADFEAFWQRFMRGDLQYGSWFKHVAGWRTVTDRPDVLLVEYERMQKDLVRVMAELSRFCGFERDTEDLQGLSPLCSFAHMKAHEDRFDHATEERSLRRMRTGEFLRKGVAGQASDYLNPSQAEHFIKEARRPQRWPEVELQLGAFLR